MVWYSGLMLVCNNYSGFRFIGAPFTCGSRFTELFLDSPNHLYTSAYKIVWLFGQIFRFIEPKMYGLGNP